MIAPAVAMPTPPTPSTPTLNPGTASLSNASGRRYCVTARLTPLRAVRNLRGWRAEERVAGGDHQRDRARHLAEPPRAHRVVPGGRAGDRGGGEEDRCAERRREPPATTNDEPCHHRADEHPHRGPDHNADDRLFVAGGRLERDRDLVEHEPRNRDRDRHPPVDALDEPRTPVSRNELVARLLMLRTNLGRRLDVCGHGAPPSRDSPSVPGTAASANVRCRIVPDFDVTGRRGAA